MFNAKSYMVFSPFPREGKGLGIGADGWHVPDPAGQFVSSYVGMGNNPVIAVDPDGRWAVGTYGGYNRMIAAAQREIARQYQDYYDWIDQFSARVGSIGNLAVWTCSIGGGSGIGIGALSFVTESGSIITTNNGVWDQSSSSQGVFYNASKGQYGQYFQTSGTALYFVNSRGQTESIYTSQVVAKWVPYGETAPAWKDVGWSGTEIIGRDWVDNTQIGLESFGWANSSKVKLFEFAAKSDKSINTLKYVKGVKVIGKVAVYGNVALTGYQTFNDIQNGKYYSATTRAAVLAIGVAATYIPYVGWFVAGGIGLADAIWGDKFYNWVELNLRKAP